MPSQNYLQPKAFTPKYRFTIGFVYSIPNHRAIEQFLEKNTRINENHPHLEPLAQA